MMSPNNVTLGCHLRSGIIYPAGLQAALAEATPNASHRNQLVWFALFLAHYKDLFSLGLSLDLFIQ